MIAPIEKTILLTGLKRGQNGRISHFTNDRIASKLMAMGLLPGTNVQFIRNAPFGGGCYIKADNMVVALRKEEANSIVLR